MAKVAKPVVCIVTPGTRTANNGNWRTAARWAALLRDHCKVIVQTEWDGTPADALIALHARRSAAAVRAFRELYPQRRIAVMLTGTDLYRDLPDSLEARQSLDAADEIVVLQDDALRLLAPPWRRKARTIYQSASPLAPVPHREGRLDCVAVGHLRAEKDPRTLFEAVRRLPPELPIRVRHIGAPLDAELGEEARRLQREEPRYRYAGAQPRGRARAAMRTAHLLVHPSVMEGGANVVVEAITAGTPVLASRMSGNVGMLGRTYPGYFEVGDAAGLAAALVRALDDARFMNRLRKACKARARLFRPESEAREVRALVARLLGRGGR